MAHSLCRHSDAFVLAAKDTLLRPEITFAPQQEVPVLLQ